MYGKVWQSMAKYGKVWQSMAKYGSVWQCMGAFAANWHSRPRTHCQSSRNQVKICDLTMMILAMTIPMKVKVCQSRGDVITGANGTLNVLAGWIGGWVVFIEEKVISDFQGFAVVKQPGAMKVMLIHD